MTSGTQFKRDIEENQELLLKYEISDYLTTIVPSFSDDQSCGTIHVLLLHFLVA